jgi:hypothetical protein
VLWTLELRFAALDPERHATFRIASAGRRQTLRQGERLAVKLHEGAALFVHEHDRQLRAVVAAILQKSLRRR